VGRRRVIVLLLLTAILVLTMDLRGNVVFDRSRTAFAWVLSPFETAAVVVTRPVLDTWRGITQFDELREQNRKLQEQIDSQRGAEIAARNAVVENQRLRALNELEALADIPTVTASIIGESPSNLDQIVEIDRGSNQGIDVGMAVVSEAGLVGKITRVFPESSLVMLITDSRYAVEAKVLSEEVPVPLNPPTVTVPSGLPADDLAGTVERPVDPPEPIVDIPTGTRPEQTEETASQPLQPGEEGTEPENLGPTPFELTPPSTSPPLVSVQRETGALMGQGAGRFPQVNFVSSTATLGRIVVGDTVFTTGGRNSLAPPDIPIGVVANVITRPGSGGTRLEVEPSASLIRLQFVRVVLYKPPIEVAG
jgi:rod shape-determining protein MreC